MTETPLVAIGGTACDDGLWNGCFDGRSPILVVAGKLPSGLVAKAERMAPYADELLAELPPRFALIGFSLGGLIALELAARAPQRIAALALVCAGAGPETPEGEALRRGGEERAKTLGMSSHARQDLVPRYGLDTFPHAVAVERMAQNVGLPLYRRQNSLAISRADSRPRLAGMPFPVRLAAGRNDTVCTPLRHEEMARAIPDVTRVVAEGCGHMLPLERPDIIAELADFLTAKAAGRH